MDKNIEDIISDIMRKRRFNSFVHKYISENWTCFFDESTIVKQIKLKSYKDESGNPCDEFVDEFDLMSLSHRLEVYYNSLNVNINVNSIVEINDSHFYKLKTVGDIYEYVNNLFCNGKNRT